MSLSKYYKHSDSFQPADIVKHDIGGKTDWTPLPRNEANIFSSQSILSKKTLPKNQESLTIPPEQTANPRPVSDEKSAGPPLPAQPPLDSDPPLPAEAIDRSKYIEIKEAERQREEAYQTGLKEGREKERKRFEEDFGAACSALLLACQQLDAVRETIIVNSSREIIDFTLAIAEKILRVSVQEQDTTIVATIEEALRRAIKSEEFSVLIHPDDYAAVAARADEIVAGISGLNNIVLRKDRSIERGGAKIESDNCTIDASITGQFELIREEVKKML